MRSVWDTPQDQAEFVDAFTEYANARWGKAKTTNLGSTWQGDDQHILFYESGGFVTWIMVPEAYQAEKIVADLP